MSATTQVKVLSPEMFHIAQGQGFHVPEASSRADNKVSPPRRAGVFQPWADPPSAESPWQANERYTPELGRAAPLSKSRRQAEEARRWYGGAAVGPSHSRGVDGLTPVADTKSTRRGRQQDVE